MQILKKNELEMVGGGKEERVDANNCACETLRTLNEDNVLETIAKNGPDCIDLCCEVNDYKRWTWFAKEYYASGECM